MSKRYDVSFIIEEIPQIIEDMNYVGLCMRRFKADYTVNSSLFSTFKVGKIIEIENKKVKIVRIGKDCFENCVLFQNNEYCPLLTNVAFGMWVE